MGDGLGRGRTSRDTLILSPMVKVSVKLVESIGGKPSVHGSVNSESHIRVRKKPSLSKPLGQKTSNPG